MAFDSNKPAASPRPEGIPLDTLPVGGRGEVLSVDATGAIGSRLRDLGFVAGTPVVLERRAPMGDPAVYVLRGTRLCLRRSEASEIRIRPLG